MDLVLIRLSPKSQSLLNAITSMIGALICLILTFFGIRTSLYFRGYQTPTVLMLSKSLLISVIFVGSFLLFIQFIRRADRYLKDWKAAEEKSPEEMPGARR